MATGRAKTAKAWRVAHAWGLAWALILALACREDPPAEAAVPDATSEARQPAVSASPRSIEVDIVGKSGSTLRGTALLTETPEGVKVRVEVRDAPPGPHGVHVHETADCSAPDAKSAGDHFDPRGLPHGLPTEREHHLGDLGNMQVTDGRATLEITVEGATLRPGEAMSFDERALIVHAQRDTGAQPSGDAGARIGCGEIRARS